MNNVYLASFSYANDSSPTSRYDSDQVNPSIFSTFADLVSANVTHISTLEIRVGYLGFCMPDFAGNWICSRDPSSFVEIINSTKSTAGDPLNIIWIAKNFQSQIVFSGLMYLSRANQMHRSRSDRSLGSHLFH